MLAVRAQAGQAKETRLSVGQAGAHYSLKLPRVAVLSRHRNQTRRAPPSTEQEGPAANGRPQRLLYSLVRNGGRMGMAGVGLEVVYVEGRWRLAKTQESHKFLHELGDSIDSW